MFRLHISFPNAAKFDRALGGLAKNISDLRPMADATIDRGIVPTLVEQFDSQGSAGANGAWAPLSEEYAKRKHGGQIEVESGALRDSLISHGAGNIREITQTEITYGTSIPYAIYQQTGTRKMPARRLFDWTAGQGDRVMKAFQASFIQYLTRLGYAIGGKAGFRDLSPGEARQIGVQELARGM